MSEVGSPTERRVGHGRWATALALVVLVLACGTQKDMAISGLDAGPGGAEWPVVNRTVPSVTPPSPDLQFSESPRDEEFARPGFLAQPLVPVGPTATQENRDLARALLAYQEAQKTGQGPDAVGPIVDFLQEHPASPWKPVLLVDLGFIYGHTGHLSNALETWQTAWDLAKGFVDPNGLAVANAALAYLTQFEAYLGRKETLGPLIDEARARPLYGTARELVSEAARGLANMRLNPQVSFKCGPSALGQILRHASSPPKPEALKVLQEAPSTPEGLSLTAVQALSIKAGMNYQMAFRARGAPAIQPAVVHWKVGHYAAALGQDRFGRYVIADPTFDGQTFVRPSTFDEEASGYFLVPPGPLPDGWRSVPAAEGDTVWGGGFVTNHDNGATGPKDIQAFPSCNGGGCAKWNVDAMVVGLSLHDDPIGYTPPLGPPVRFPIDYSFRSATQAMTASPAAWGGFGHQWTHGWFSLIRDDITCTGTFYSQWTVTEALASGNDGNVAVVDIRQNPPNACATLIRRGGGTEPYVFPADIAPSMPPTIDHSAPGQFSHAVMTRTRNTSSGPVTSYMLSYPDGSVELFGLQVGLAGTSFWYLTKIVDPQGNAVTLTYDSNLRLVAIQDAIGQATRLCYSDSAAPCVAPAAGTAPPDHFGVTQVIDPFNRSATFGYNSSGQLASIKDVLGITSSFQYLAGSDFITSLTTPYSKPPYTNHDPTPTMFSYGDSLTSSTLGTERYVQAVDPLNRTSRVEFKQRDSTSCPPDPTVLDPVLQLPCAEAAVPTGMSVQNLLLTYRDTFIWDPWQYQRASASNQAAGKMGLDYRLAREIHWLHADDTDVNLLTASRIPESTKEPLENRVWFAYPDQKNDPLNGNGYAPTLAGSSNTPIAAGRVLSDGSTQLWRYKYNAIGNPIQVIDPIGRTTRYTYDTNGIDLLTVANTTGGRNDVLTSYSNYNSQHEPQTVTDTRGAKTQYTYNSNGTVSLVNTASGTQNVFLYDGSGARIYQVNLVAPNGQSIQNGIGYDGLGRVASTSTSDGTSLRYSYDAADRVTQVTFADNTFIRYDYTLLDLTKTTDRRGYATVRKYDADRELTEIDEPTGPLGPRVTKLSYWPNKKINTITEPKGGVTTYLLDDAGRTNQIAYPDTFAGTSIVYDSATSRVSKVLKGGGRSVTYQYYADDTISARTDENGQGYRYSYDSVYPRLIEWDYIRQNPPAILAGEVRSYNPITPPGGQVIPSNNQLGSVKTYMWDFSPYASGSYGLVDEVDYQYNDPLGRLTQRTIVPGGSASGAPTTETYSYDPYGRVQSDANPLDTFNYIYNPTDSVPMPRVSTITSKAGPQANFAYYPGTQFDGRLKSLTYTAPVSLSGTPVGSIAASYTYGSYDANGNLAQFGESYSGGSAGGGSYGGGLGNASVSTSYAYDAYNQLSTATLNTGGTFSYPSDLDGNLTGIATYNKADQIYSSGTTPAPAIGVWGMATLGLMLLFVGIRTVSARNRPRAVGIATILIAMLPLSAAVASSLPSAAYDPDGKLTQLTVTEPGASSPTTTNYTWTSFGELQSATRSDGEESLFYYDGLGRLAQVVEHNGSATSGNHSYLWCGAVRCLQQDNTRGTSNGAPVTRRYYPQGFVDANVGSAYYLTDALGSVRALLDPTGAALAQYDYDPYGNRTTLYSTLGGFLGDVDVGFAGYFHHATSEGQGVDGPPEAHLLFARDRAYSPFLGRWMSRDPSGAGPALATKTQFSATDLNLYAYASNNPTTLTDPSGNCPSCIGAVGGFVVGAIWYAATAPTNLSWGDFATGAFAYGSLGAAAGASGAFLGTLAGGGTVAGALGLSDTGATLAAAASGGAILDKPAVPAIPAGFASLNEFGKAIGWGTGNEAAIERAETITADELNRLGVTQEMAAQWRDFYDAISTQFPDNPSAAGRAILMSEAADKLNCQ